MLLSTLFVAFFATLAFAFKVHEVFEINAPGTENHGKICVVENANYFHPNAPEVSRVSVFAFNDEELKRYGENGVTVKRVIKYLALLDSQLKPISHNSVAAPLLDDQRVRLAKLVEHILNVNETPKNFRIPKFDIKIHLIGAWIGYTYGFEGMVSVCDTLPPHIEVVTEFLWDYYCDFKREKYLKDYIDHTS